MIEDLKQEEKELIQNKGMPAYAGVVLKMCQALSLKMLLTTLIEKNYIDIDYNLTEDGKNLFRELCNFNTEKNVFELQSLYNNMRELFPKGNKPSTNTSWRGNPTTCINKLKKFFQNYGDFTNEEILQATKNYVESFKKRNSYSYMRVLPYFISKLENGEEKSNLADELFKLRDNVSEYDEQLGDENDFLEIDDTDYNNRGRMI